jgi:hypothetical protein
MRNPSLSVASILEKMIDELKSQPAPMPASTTVPGPPKTCPKCGSPLNHPFDHFPYWWCANCDADIAPHCDHDWKLSGEKKGTDAIMVCTKCGKRNSGSENVDRSTPGVPHYGAASIPLASRSMSTELKDGIRELVKAGMISGEEKSDPGVDGEYEKDEHLFDEVSYRRWKEREKKTDEYGK